MLQLHVHVLYMMAAVQMLQDTCTHVAALHLLQKSVTLAVCGLLVLLRSQVR